MTYDTSYTRAKSETSGFFKNLATTQMNSLIVHSFRDNNPAHAKHLEYLQLNLSILYICYILYIVYT